MRQARRVRSDSFHDRVPIASGTSSVGVRFVRPAQFTRIWTLPNSESTACKSPFDAGVVGHVTSPRSEHRRADTPRPRLVLVLRGGPSYNIGSSLRSPRAMPARCARSADHHRRFVCQVKKRMPMKRSSESQCILHQGSANPIVMADAISDVDI